MIVQNINTKIYYGQEDLKVIIEDILKHEFMKLFKQERC